MGDDFLGGNQRAKWTRPGREQPTPKGQVGRSIRLRGAKRPRSVYATVQVPLAPFIGLKSRFLSVFWQVRYCLCVHPSTGVQSRTMKLTKTTRTFALLAIALAASGCSTVEFKQLGMEPLKNAQGHVVGQKETLCDCANGERLARIALYAPRVDEHGTVVGYEEQIKGGTVLRDLQGRRIGARWIDLRSRTNNPNNRGLTIIVHSRPAAERQALA